jgi:hypothetical protein
VRAVKTTTISILALGLVAGSALGVAAQDEEAAASAVSFTGSVRGGEGADIETTALPNGYMAMDGFTYRNTWESSDERLTGEVSGVNNFVVDPDGFRASATGGKPNIIQSLAIELTNDGGRWLGEGRGFGSTDLDIVKEMYTLVGQGGYEGLTAYVIVEVTQGPPTFSGIIFPTAMPEMPEPYAE